MIHAPTILIVHENVHILARLTLKLAGFDLVSTATTFNDAKALLTASPPAILITGVRLGEYNGLHLIVRSRLDSPATAGIVILDRPDAAVEQEATRLGAACLSYPENEAKLLLLVDEALLLADV